MTNSQQNEALPITNLLEEIQVTLIRKEARDA